MLTPRSTAEARRLEHSRLRQRILDGLWRSDAYQRMVDTVGQDRSRAWGSEAIVDIGSPLLKTASIRNATLYLRPPYFEHPEDDASAPALNELLRRARWGSLMTSVLQQAIGLNDAALRYEVSLDELGEPVLRLYPRSVSEIMARGREDDPSQALRVYETVKYRGNDVWRVWTDTERWLEDEDGHILEGTRDVHNQGRCPWVLWHATPNNRLFSPYANAELVDLTLNLAVAESFRSHAYFEAAWPQRYAVGVQPAGMGIEGMDDPRARQAVTADPATVLLLESTGESQAMIGQWTSGADPLVMSQATDRQQRRASLAIGQAGTDVYRASGETRSAYALALTRAGQREQQTALAPLMQPSDVYLAEGIARAVNAQTGREWLAEDGYRIRYRILSPSKEEVDLVRSLLDGGMIDEDAARLMLDPFAEPAGSAIVDEQPDTAGPLEAVDASEVSELALNGAQVTAAQGIVEAAAAGKLPRSSAVAMLEAFFVMPAETAEMILGPVGRGFTPAADPTE